MTGSGTLLDPYVIWDVNDLQDMNLDLTAYYELGQDIDAAATVGWNGGLGFDPIGDHPAPAFTGHFDGKGFKITDLVINRPLEAYVGLFGYTAGLGGEIKNVGLEDCQVTGSDEVGGLIGFNDDARVISNCWVTGQITVSDQGGALQTLAGGLTGYCDGVTSDCYFSGTFTLNDGAGHRYRQMGGLIGLIGGGTVTRCYSLGLMALDGVAGSEIWEFGGFAGMNTGASISQCFSAMDIVVNGDDIWGIGGFIADNSFPISDCYARGDVTANGTPADVTHIAGFVAFNVDDIDNCYSTGEIITNGLGNVGGLIAENWGGTVVDSFWDTDTSGTLISDGGTGRTTAQMKDSATFIATGWGFGAEWGMTPPCNNGYPCLLTVTSGCLWAPVVIPTVTTNSATDILQELATVNGTLDDDGGEACDCGFEWGETIAYGNTTPTQSRTTGQTFSQALSGLSPNIIYHFRAFATNSEGTGYGADRTFTTQELLRVNRAYALSREEL